MRGFIRVTLLDGSRLEAELVGTDHNTLMSRFIKIEQDEALPILPLADSSKVRVGQFAIAIGKSVWTGLHCDNGYCER